MKTCPECKTQYPGGEQFCPTDGARLLSASQIDIEAVTRDPLIGTTVGGRYRVIRVLGEGGMGVVYEAEHTVIEKRVALKVLRPDFSARPDVVERFRQEAKSASRIGHENIIDISDFGETNDGASFFVMEMLAGRDLAHAIAETTVIPLARAIPILIQCCKALGAAHAKGIVHRDMKPENVFLTAREGNPEFVKIVDFGIAKMSDLDHPGSGGKKLTKTGMIFGTPEYMSPEQAAGRPPDHRVDIYALGVIAFEMFAGRVPFVGDTFMAILTQHITVQPPEIREVYPATDCPPALEAVIRRAMAKDPRDRQSSMAELAQQILAAVEDVMPGQFRGPTHIPAPAVQGGAAPTQVPALGAATAADARATAKTAAFPGATQTPTPVVPAQTMPGSDSAPAATPSSARGVVIAGGVGVLIAAAVAGVYFGFLRPGPIAQVTDAGTIEPLRMADATVVTTGGSEDARVVEEDASMEVVAADAGTPDDAAVAVAMDAAVTNDNVQVAITSTPSGAEVRVGGRGIVCASTPCFFETPRGRTIEITLFGPRRTQAEETLTPNENAALHLRLRRADAPEMDAGRRAQRDAGRAQARDAGARPQPRDAGRRPRPGCIEGLRCPDFGL
ncbi:MAG: protein kinase [Deltaproteobacteria bacterium]|nr:protein kinase [Deltaproteobacteria bacterium]